mmetsp:Transcript_21599/g.42960  ORF Transcript_21599/g.42960 Transcript_21599/m.42960 type:complete len:250 (-) Transcript_21599:1687-2436(-)
MGLKASQRLSSHCPLNSVLSIRSITGLLFKLHPDWVEERIHKEVNFWVPFCFLEFAWGAHRLRTVLRIRSAEVPPIAASMSKMAATSSLSFTSFSASSPPAASLSASEWNNRRTFTVPFCTSSPPTIAKIGIFCSLAKSIWRFKFAFFLYTNSHAIPASHNIRVRARRFACTTSSPPIPHTRTSVVFCRTVLMVPDAGAEAAAPVSPSALGGATAIPKRLSMTANTRSTPMDTPTAGTSLDEKLPTKRS